MSGVLEAWRRAERRLVAMARSDEGRRRVEAEIARLRGEYQRLVDPRLHEAESAQADDALRSRHASGWPRQTHPEGPPSTPSAPPSRTVNGSAQ